MQALNIFSRMLCHKYFKELVQDIKSSCVAVSIFVSTESYRKEDMTIPAWCVLQNSSTSDKSCILTLILLLTGRSKTQEIKLYKPQYGSKILQPRFSFHSIRIFVFALLLMRVKAFQSGIQILHSCKTSLLLLIMMISFTVSSSLLLFLPNFFLEDLSISHLSTTLL